jgi:hypothetical protein
MIPVVRALVACFVVHPDQEEALGPELDTTTTEVVRKVSAMPRYMSLGMHLLTVVFDWWGLLTAGRRFRALPRAQRERQVRVWQGSPLGLMRDTVEFYEKMGTFVFWSGREEPHG